MNWNDFQDWIQSRWAKPQYRDSATHGTRLYISNALAGEVGELANVIKKIERDDAGHLSQERRTDLVNEAGDVLHYLIRLCQTQGILMEEVIDYNVQKLTARDEQR